MDSYQSMLGKARLMHIGIGNLEDSPQFTRIYVIMKTFSAILSPKIKIKTASIIISDFWLFITTS